MSGPMDWDEFSGWGARIADWSGGYHKSLRDKPVRAQVRPGEIAAQVPETPPEAGEGMEAIFADFERIAMPGITHWQHPRFMAYFPANAAPPSILAEFVVAALAPQCMLWQTSPAATEIETRMLDWLRQAVGLPEGFHGVIQDSASGATLAAVLAMRERATGWRGNAGGLSDLPVLRVYTSAEAHSSVERAAWIAGIGGENLVRVPVSGPLRGIEPEALAAAIRSDRAAGFLPVGVVASTGATGTGACDDLEAVVGVAKSEGLFTHVDAAWAGSAMICPEFRHLWAGVEDADSIVFNPHKWLGAQFDCSAHFLRDPEVLVRTLAIHPEYLKTHGHDGLINYSEWSVPLGRRFRALKLWFLIRHYGLEGLRERLRGHVRMAADMARLIAADPRFEIVTAPVLSLFSFRLAGCDDAAQLAFVGRVNDDGRTYLTQTRVDRRIAVRVQVGQFGVTDADVAVALDAIREMAQG
jgi:aromatic-L-amino-acid decarboxylase